jgi:GT2 family glycosyltransferase
MFAKKYLINGVDPISVYGIPGCVMLFSKTAFNQIQGFDARTFLGWEEYIIAEKLLSRGFATWVVPKSQIFHKVGQWSKVNYSRDMSAIFLESEKIYLHDYRKMNGLEVFLIKVVKLITYSLEALFRPGARKALPNLLRKIGEL